MAAHGDSRLIDLVSYGFPMGMVGPRPGLKKVTNHSSAWAYPEVVMEYLQKETEKGSYWACLVIYLPSISTSPHLCPNPRMGPVGVS